MKDIKWIGIAYWAREFIRVNPTHNAFELLRADASTAWVNIV